MEGGAKPISVQNSLARCHAAGDRSNQTTTPRTVRDDEHTHAKRPEKTWKTLTLLNSQALLQLHFFTALDATLHRVHIIPGPEGDALP